MNTQEKQEFVGEDFYKCKKTGELFTEDEMLEQVDLDDNLDSFYLVGTFDSREDAMEYVKKNF